MIKLYKQSTKKENIMSMKIWEKLNYTAWSLFLPRKHRWMKYAHYRWAKKEKGAQCWITGKKTNLESHHAFSYRSWFLFRFVDANKVYLHVDVHKEYHEWMGGTMVMTTPFSLMRFKRLYLAKQQKNERGFSWITLFSTIFTLVIIVEILLLLSQNM